uniref:Uncharacterized protein n=1 Tax=Arundo donax TaxID=35708 RepID=A0A0A9AYM5_ARUDO
MRDGSYGFAGRPAPLSGGGLALGPSTPSLRSSPVASCPSCELSATRRRDIQPVRTLRGRGSQQS